MPVGPSPMSGSGNGATISRCGFPSRGCDDVAAGVWGLSCSAVDRELDGDAFEGRGLV
jgi:hypothetical protein